MVFTADEIANFSSTVRDTLRRSVETGHRVLPSGFAFFTVSPHNQQPFKSLRSFHGEDMSTPNDLSNMSKVIRGMAMAGRAQAAGLVVIADRDVLPSSEMFNSSAETLAVVYLDNVQGRYQVWFAPVLYRRDDTPTLGPFQEVERATFVLPHLLPMDLYGSVVGTA